MDTDVIIPARYLNAPDDKSLASHCMEDIDADFAATVEPGDIIVAGANFGCGSSREHAPLAIKACGVKCVIAAILCPHFLPQRHQHRLPHHGVRRKRRRTSRPATRSTVDFATGMIVDQTTGKTYQAAPFPEFIDGIIDNGGLLASLKARGIAK